MSTSPRSLFSRLLLPGTIVGVALGAAPAPAASTAYHQCAPVDKLYPWVSSLHGVSRAKACRVIVALGKDETGTKFPSLEGLIACEGAEIDADGTETSPGTARLKRTSWQGWRLTYDSKGLKLAKGSKWFRAGQQDFGCFWASSYASADLSGLELVDDVEPMASVFVAQAMSPPEASAGED